MYTQTILVALLSAVAQARFAQEQGNGAIDAISALNTLGQSGQAATLAGQSISFLLAAANPCGKLTQADLIITQLGTSDAAIKAARGLVAAEQNFNPFVTSIPSICSDPTLPTTAALRGVVPLIDPAVTGQDIENANSATSIVTPFAADGLSVAQVMIAQGFSNFTAVDAAGNKVAASTLGGAGAVVSSAVDTASTTAAAVVASSTAVACGGTTFVTVTNAATTAATVATSTAAAQASAAPATGGATDFGSCSPAMDFQLGRTGRKATEGTFLPSDPTVAAGQQDALNPNIITNAICNNLINKCGLTKDSPGEVACLAAKATIQALGTKDASTAAAWNAALGV